MIKDYKDLLEEKEKIQNDIFEQNEIAAKNIEAMLKILTVQGEILQVMSGNLSSFKFDMSRRSLNIIETYSGNEKISIQNVIGNKFKINNVYISEIKEFNFKGLLEKMKVILEYIQEKYTDEILEPKRKELRELKNENEWIQDIIKMSGVLNG